MLPINDCPKIIRSFGRIKSRKLSPCKNNILNNLYPKYQLSEENFANIYLNYSKINLEIGCGDGDFMYNMAQQNRDQLFIGFEPYINGVINLLARLQKANLNNILIYNGDFRQKFDYLCNKGSNYINKIYILFPDPWPKAKHFKRRLISPNFLDYYISPLLSYEGDLIISTDHDSLKLWVLWSIKFSKKFIWQANDPSNWQNFPEYWHNTKYQLKAKTQQRSSIFISAKNVK